MYVCVLCGGGGGGGALKTGSLGSSEKMWVLSKVAKKAWWIHFEKKIQQGKIFRIFNQSTLFKL